jgi:hypothetical protein
MMSELQQQQFENDLRAVFEAGAGAMSLTIISPRTAFSVVVDAMNGDARAKLVLQATDQLLRKIDRRSRARALPCMLCDDGVLWRGEAPAAVGVLTPFGVVAVRTAVGMAVCADCATDRTEAELARAAVRKFRAGMMPDLRVLPPMPAAGHA